ncbi:MAG: glycosyltransferase [bacterium]|nr:glycosyltransferase [bacterium]
MKSSNPSVSVIVPFLNEPNILRTYQKIKSELQSYPNRFQIVFVSDGSKPSAITVLKKAIKKDKQTMLVEYRPNRGRGYAVKQGFKNANGEYLLYIDSDLDIHERHIKKILAALKKFDVAIGSKVHPKSHVNTRFTRKIASPLLNAIVRVGLGTNVHDHHVGLKGFRKEVIKTILPSITQSRWMFDAEIIKLARDNNFTIGEVPVSMTYGTGPLRLSYARYFWDILVFIMAFRLKRLKLQATGLLGVSE